MSRALKVSQSELMVSTTDADLEGGATLNNPYPFSPSTAVGEVSQGDHKKPDEDKGIEITKTVELDFLKHNNDTHDSEEMTTHGTDHEV